ncbi:hypothetical protein Tco_0344747 [Tanacetum coccineum]
MDSSFNNENDPWKYSLDIDDSDLHLTPVLCSSSSTYVEPSPSTLNPIRIIPGPADGALMSTQEYMQKVVEDVGEDDDFKNEKKRDIVEQLERLGHIIPQDISVGLILNGLTSDFAGFVRNYNMRNIGKTVGELHALLIECEKGLPKKAATPQVMAIQGGRNPESQ